MAEFHIRSWQEQILFDGRDYTVEAETLEEALPKIQAAQSEADDQDKPYIDRDIRPMQDAHVAGVVSLDPSEIVGSGAGFTLIDGDGNRIRDLVGVLTDCVQLGAQMDDAVANEENDP